MKTHNLIEWMKSKIPDEHLNSCDIEIHTPYSTYTLKQEHHDGRVQFKEEKVDEFLG